ncbi:hypothetical protein Lalb_Chr18g0048711 [Lupinus albus]|uniref:Uncharacterized protein n=1 Tax=Lupinus albus TaxID=3870 RepID=A0A6A4NJW6_LUPAL|nr:hypothetical protein Lalb_Chr18g0048711 [Lupinus albus]
MVERSYKNSGGFVVGRLLPLSSSTSGDGGTKLQKQRRVHGWSSPSSFFSD